MQKGTVWLVVGSSLRQPVGYMVGLFALRKRARGLKKKKAVFQPHYGWASVVTAGMFIFTEGNR